LNLSQEMKNNNFILLNLNDNEIHFDMKFFMTQLKKSGMFYIKKEI